MREGTCHPYLYVVVGLFVLYSSTNFDIKTCVYTCIHMYTIIHKYIGNAYARTYVFTCLLSYMYMCVDMGSCTHTHATHKTSTYLPTYLPIPPYLPPCLLSACLPLYIHSFIHSCIHFIQFIHSCAYTTNRNARTSTTSQTSIMRSCTSILADLYLLFAFTCVPCLSEAERCPAHVRKLNPVCTMQNHRPRGL